jgi:hypothetical protein
MLWLDLFPSVKENDLREKIRMQMLEVSCTACAASMRVGTEDVRSEISSFDGIPWVASAIGREMETKSIDPSDLDLAA